MRPKKEYLLILLIIFLNCSNKEKKKQGLFSMTNTEQKEEVSKPEKAGLDTNNFIYKNITHIDVNDMNDYDYSEGKFLLKEIEKENRKKWFDDIYPLKNDYYDYSAEYYSIQNQIGYIQPIIVEASTQYKGYVVVFLLNLSEEGERISYIELSGSSCEGPRKDEKLKRIFWCNKKTTEFENDSVFTVITKKTQSDDYHHCNFYIDSLTAKYKITHQGLIENLYKDSVRVVRYQEGP